jgi:hypothetical protein
MNVTIEEEEKKKVNHISINYHSKRIKTSLKLLIIFFFFINHSFYMDNSSFKYDIGVSIVTYSYTQCDMTKNKVNGN